MFVDVLLLAGLLLAAVLLPLLVPAPRLRDCRIGRHSRLEPR